jgi:PKD repeat protein
MPSPNGNHNAGGLVFGKDGYLYISIGDGGCEIGSPGECGGDNDNARVINRLQGKILRVTRDGKAPTSNPFYSQGGECRISGSTTAGMHCRETYAWGFRNPFRIAADPNGTTTRIFANDVGQNLWEEVDHVLAGKDYGWNNCEGFHANSSYSTCGFADQDPIFEYGHGSCNSLSGGAFIPNGVWPSTYDGTYFFSDYTCGTIWTLTNSGGTWSRTTFASGLGAVTELEFGPYGSNVALYYADYGSSQIRRISYNAANNQAPVADIKAAPTFGAVPLTVAFDGRGSSDPDADPLTYRWDFGDGTSSTRSTFSKTYKTAKKFRVTLTVTDGKGGTDTDAVTINAGNTRPSAEITAPSASSQFSVGQMITLTGLGTDTEDGALSSSRMTWEVLLHHDTHTHPWFGPVKGNNLTFQAPAPEDLKAAGTSYLEIKLTVRDSGGLGKLVTMNLMPNKVNVTVGSNVPGMLLWIEGSPYRAPATVLTWANNPLTVVAPDQIGPDDAPYIYKSWSDGGRRSHEYVAPASDSTVTATFNLLPGNAFAPHADARVSEANPTRNEGLGTGLSVKGGTSSDYETLIRFKVSGVGDRVYRARLYLYAYDPTVDGPSIYTTSSSWRETGLTWNTRPGPTSSQFDNYGPIADNSWIAYDVTSAISGDGYVTFLLRGTSSDAVSWYSRQAGSRQPRLVIWSSGVTTAEVPPEPTTTPEPSPEASPIAHPTESASPEPTEVIETPTPVASPETALPITDDFEGNLSGWSGEGALLAPGTGRDDTQAAQMRSSGSDMVSGTPSYLQRALPAGETNIHVALDVMPRTLDSGVTRFVTITGADNAATAALYLGPDGLMGIRFGEGDSLIPVGSIHTSNWSRIEVAFAAESGSATVQIWVNGQYAGSATDVAAPTELQTVVLGGWATDRTFDLLIDNVAIDRGCISGCPALPAPVETNTPVPAPGDVIAPDPGTPVSG